MERSCGRGGIVVEEKLWWKSGIRVMKASRRVVGSGRIVTDSWR